MEIINLRRLATAAIIQYPSILGEFDLAPKHFGHQKALWSLVKTVPLVPDRNPAGGVPEGHLAALAGVDDQVVDALLKRRYHGQDAARDTIRRLIRATTEEEVRAKLRYLAEGHNDLVSGIEEARQLLSAEDDRSVVTLSTLLEQELAVIEDGKEDEGLIKTGIPGLDRALRGFLPGELIIIAAPAGVGKTTFALHVMRYLAERETHSAFFSGEMSDAQMRKKLSHAESGVKMTEALGAEDLRNALKSSTGGYCHFDFNSSLTPAKITASIRRMQERHGLGIAFFDHMRHIDVGVGGDNQYLKISRTAGAAKAIALDSKLPFVVLTHFSRSHVESKRPSLEMIRDSGVIGEDADTVICPWRPPGNLHTELWVLKARMTGEQGIKVCELAFDSARQSFAELDEWRAELEKQGGGEGGEDWR